MTYRASARLIVMAALFVTVLTNARAHKSEPIPPDMMGKPATIVGYVRDIACLLRNKTATVGKDQESRKCVLDCVKAGSPLAILTKSGELYMPISDKIPDANERLRLLPYAGKYIKVSGRVFERAGTHAINIEKIEEVTGW